MDLLAIVFPPVLIAFLAGALLGAWAMREALWRADMQLADLIAGARAAACGREQGGVPTGAGGDASRACVSRPVSLEAEWALLPVEVREALLEGARAELDL